MFKRVTWMGVGLVAGFGASKWVERQAHRTLARHVPGGRLTLETVADLGRWASQRAHDTLADLADAMEQGREAAGTRRAELRQQLNLAEPPVPAGGFVSGKRALPAGPRPRRAQ